MLFHQTFCVSQECAWQYSTVCNLHVFAHLKPCSGLELVQLRVVFRKRRDLILTPWSKALLKKLRVSQLIKKFFTFYGTQM
jgi:hypothetical protein